MLTFLAGMVGFCLTGDIFDLFVWFELMGVSAYALTAYPVTTQSSATRSVTRTYREQPQGGRST
jgi:formate hydrogenlyase subunit 3/multisubunit Na+/H+ antiporter MnhD subunit